MSQYRSTTINSVDRVPLGSVVVFLRGCGNLEHRRRGRVVGFGCGEGILATATRGEAIVIDITQQNPHNSTVFFRRVSATVEPCPSHRMWLCGHPSGPTELPRTHRSINFLVICSCCFPLWRSMASPGMPRMISEIKRDLHATLS